MKKKTAHTLFVPTLVDASDVRHIIPSKDKPALCGATGAQQFPHDWKADELCQRCVQKQMKLILEARLTEFGL